MRHAISRHFAHIFSAARRGTALTLTNGKGGDLRERRCLERESGRRGGHALGIWSLFSLTARYTWARSTRLVHKCEPYGSTDTQGVRIAECTFVP